MKKLKTKNLKPIDCDAHFKYKCPNCSCDHWLSYRQTRTKHFKVVCDCDSVFEVKTIKSIEITYIEDIQQSVSKPINNIPVTTEPQKQNIQIPVDILNKCSKLLVGYGFTLDETKKMLTKAYLAYPNDDCATLIKIALGNTLGEKND